jgi:glucan phosphoethanolaminetransferase (alkaline phosphatase superfamily)
MLRSAFALFSSLQVGARIKQSIESYIRQAIVIAVAAIAFIAATAFGLVAAYHALVSIYGFTPMEAAGIVAGLLILLGVLILALLPLVGRKRRAEAQGVPAVVGEGAAIVDQSVGRAMQQVGPVTLLAIAFLAGVLLSRRR